MFGGVCLSTQYLEQQAWNVSGRLFGDGFWFLPRYDGVRFGGKEKHSTDYLENYLFCRTGTVSCLKFGI